MKEETVIVICVAVGVIGLVFLQRGCVEFNINENEYYIEQLRIREGQQTVPSVPLSRRIEKRNEEEKMTRNKSPKDLKGSNVSIVLRGTPRSFICKLIELDIFGVIVLQKQGNQTKEFFIPLTSIAYIETLTHE